MEVRPESGTVHDTGTFGGRKTRMSNYLTREDLQRAMQPRKSLTKEEAEQLWEAWKKQLSFTITDVEKGDRKK
jgi:hypothetical protein